MAKDIRIIPASGEIKITGSADFTGDGGSSVLFVSGSGNVGIGTTSPSTKFEVHDSNSELNIFGDSGGALYLSSPTGELRFRANGGSTNRLVLNNSLLTVAPDAYFQNDVGIGTTSPSYKLDVSGSGNFTDGLTVTGSILHDGDLTVTGKVTAEEFHTEFVSASIIYQSGSTKFGDTSDDIHSFTGSIQQSGSDSYFLGNVGIGTSTPAYLFEVEGGRAQFETTPGGGGTEGIRVGGIRGLFTDGSDNQGLHLFSNVDIGYPSGWAGGFANTPERGVSSYGGANLGYAAGDVTLVVGGGNVGIGTTSPQKKLHISNSSPDGIALQNTAGQTYNITSGIPSVTNGGLAFAEGSTVRLFIDDTSGNVGIGTTSPSYRLDVQGDTRISNTTPKLIIKDSNGSGETNPAGWIQWDNSANDRLGYIGYGSSSNQHLYIRNETSAGDLRFFTKSAERMTILGTGDIGIGTTSPSTLLHLGKESDGVNIITMGAASFGGPHGIDFLGNDATETRKYSIYYRTTPAAISFENEDGVKTLEIDQSGGTQISGSLSVGNISPSATLGRIDASNDVVAYSTSDFQLKENITPITNALDKIAQIEGVEFDWKEISDEERKYVHGNHGHDIGVIAQQIEKILPEAVQTRENGYKAVDYKKIIPLLIETIKELNHKVDSQEERLSRLEKLL